MGIIMSIIGFNFANLGKISKDFSPQKFFYKVVNMYFFKKHFAGWKKDKVMIKRPIFQKFDL